MDCFRDNYEQMKSDAKHLQTELDRIITHRPGKVIHFSFSLITFRKILQERQLNALIATIDQFCAKEESLQSELGSDLVSQLTVDEQATVDQLNDTIEQITQELKEIIKKRVEVNDGFLLPEKCLIGFCSLKEIKLDLNIKLRIIIERIVIKSALYVRRNHLNRSDYSLS